MLFNRKRKDNALLGVSLTSAGVALACIERASGVPPTLKFCTWRPLEPEEDEKTVLARLVKTHELGGYRSTSTLGLGSYSLLLVDAPDVPPAELRAAMRWRIKDLIDFHVDDAVVDVFEVARRAGAGGSRLMYAVAARAAPVRRQIEMLRSAGLRLEVVDIPELALRNLAALLPEDVAGVALVYLAPEGGVITLTHQSRLYLSRLLGAPAAGRSGGARERDQDRLDGIVIEVQRSMDYYESHFAQPPIGAVVVAPSEDPVEGMTEYLSSELGVPARTLDLGALVDVEAPIEARLQARCLLAVGAALREEPRSL